MVCSSRRVVALEKEAAPGKSFSSFISFILYARCVCVIIYHIKSSDAALSDEKRRVLFVGTRAHSRSARSSRPSVHPPFVRSFGSVSENANPWASHHPFHLVILSVSVWVSRTHCLTGSHAAEFQSPLMRGEKDYLAQHLCIVFKYSSILSSFSFFFVTQNNAARCGVAILY